MLDCIWKSVTVFAYRVLLLSNPVKEDFLWPHWREECFMLLSLMRKHAKSWLIKFMIAIIAIVFTFYFGYSFRADRGGKVASVNGEVISLKEYEKAYRSLLDFYQQQYCPTLANIPFHRHETM